MSEEFEVRNEDVFTPDPELAVPVILRYKETGKRLVTFFYNEEEVDRRMAFLEGHIPEGDPYREVVDQINKFHEARRAWWKLEKDKVEIIPLPFPL